MSKRWLLEPLPEADAATSLAAAIGISSFVASLLVQKGITSFEQAKAAGIDATVCDHHEPGDILPAAYAILDPKQPTCSYPFEELSGCGIGG